ncbi:flagellar hook-basal body complex protein FliE [Pseudoroseicyclus aestuarii]|uniref:Flagellar hook-basal body complex protein FliE n=1 Tax=Pseudoroseicyclus aestuarii TaxID=1795041 RepID=A0A318SW28_9RHOB|nr:flagellar hook-basal body complex protein FliE [Pseudoroseicyclus aestuarii]PYE84579.1 flagellar hook-basal body complex protein FliE [Pseudoroseicyclus aestuarii]
MELGSLVAQAYRGTRQSVSAEMPQPPRDEAANPAGAAAAEFVRTLRESDATAMQSMTGSGDPHALVQALSQAELAVETVVTLRNKVVEAYQEILRMPV